MSSLTDALKSANMKLSFSGDLGSPHYWDRLVAFAQRHGAERLVFWGDYGTADYYTGV